MTNPISILSGISHVVFYLGTFLFCSVFLISDIGLQYIVLFSLVLSVSISSSIEVCNMKLGIKWLSSRFAIIGILGNILFISFAYYNLNHFIEVSNLDPANVSFSSIEITFWVSLVSGVILLFSVFNKIKEKKNVCENLLRQREKILENIKYLKDRKTEWIDTSGPELTVAKLDKARHLLNESTSKYKLYDFILTNFYFMRSLTDNKDSVHRTYILNKIEDKNGVRIKIAGIWHTVPSSINLQ